ncbi:hypothetical protein [Zavarzinia compransoris]|uniref:Uncharacterized protein n=1 Tax=Zavarzinia compransoris TaxID=1264899 RepID=A0A317E499_9PROT|nr:hypothetical protein [Zavarzinia compransoris]PWR21819.1 hypothetical protein DKG75_07470 [Zavarzinia compransoris]TDP45381.1 hypothetical protein DES42_10584 [Zavarzinia compransoris]
MPADPVSGPLAAPRLGPSTDNARQPPQSGLPGQHGQGGIGAGAAGSPALPAGAAAAPSVRLAAELLRLDPGQVLETLVGGPDGEGRPTLVTSAGLFAVTNPRAALPPPGTPLSIEVIGSGELLSVLLRGGPARNITRSFDLQFLGAADSPAPEAEALSRPLYQAVQVAADGQRRMSLALRLGVAGPAGPDVLAATVIARRPQPDGTVALTLSGADGSTINLEDAPAGIATGTRLLLDVASRRPLGPLPERPAAGPAALPSLAGAPPAIRQFATGRLAIAATEALLGPGTDAAPDLSLARLLPGLAQPGGQTLAVALLGAALRFKDFRRLIGPEREKALAAEGPAPLLRASAEFADLGRATGETSPQGWRAVPLPFFDGRDIVPITLYVHRQPPPEDKAGPEDREAQRRGGQGGNTRFLVEVSLSQLGALQIDGFAQPGRVDTILRSRSPLDLDLRQTLIARYQSVLAEAGLAGTLGFQVQDNPLGSLGIGSEQRPATGGSLSITA